MYTQIAHCITGSGVAWLINFVFLFAMLYSTSRRALLSALQTLVVSLIGAQAVMQVRISRRCIAGSVVVVVKCIDLI
jgi:hypothetical protein